MKTRGRSRLTRRELLKGSLGVALTAGCFTSLELRRALAQARATGKPLLIESELNAHIPRPRDRQAYLAHIDHPQRDLLGYLNTNFQLTPLQIQAIQSIPREDLLQLNALLDRARANNLQITVRVIRRGEAGPPPGPNLVYLRSLPITTRGEKQQQQGGSGGFWDKILGVTASPEMN